MPTWNDRRDSPRLVASLASLVMAGAVGDADRPALQRANESAWQDLVLLAPDAALEALKGASLLIESGESVASVDVEALRQGTATLYVTGDRDSLRVRLVREAGYLLLVVPGVAEMAYQLLCRINPGAIRHVDAAELSVAVDGTNESDDLEAALSAILLQVDPVIGARGSRLTLRHRATRSASLRG